MTNPHAQVRAYTRQACTRDHISKSCYNIIVNHHHLPTPMRIMDMVTIIIANMSTAISEFRELHLIANLDDFHINDKLIKF